MPPRQPRLRYVGAMDTLQTRSRSWWSVKNVALSLLLLLATMQCVESIFVGNVTFLNLKMYDHGGEKMPFQGRIGMMVVGRAAETNRVMQKASTMKFFHGFERNSPEKVAFLAAGMGATWAAVGFAAFYASRRTPGIWWFAPALFVYMLYVTYAARSDAQLWYPYDLPHFALFGAAAVCILEGWWLPAFCLFLVDLPVRETSVFLVSPMLMMGYARKRRAPFVYATAMLLVWIPVRLAISHHFAGNPTDTGIHSTYWVWLIINPYKWGQWASAFGFLAVPFAWGFKLLTRQERLFVYSAAPALAVTALYGIWEETRIWDEWLLPFAVLFSFQALRFLAQSNPSELLQERPGERGHSSAA